MEQTFFILLKTIPEPGSVIDPRIEGALTHCWVIESDPLSAMMKASYKVRQSGWRIERVDTPPVAVTRDEPAGKDWGLDSFDQCQRDGMALAFVGHSKAEELYSDEPQPAPVVPDINLHEWLSDQKRVKNAGEKVRNFLDTTKQLPSTRASHDFDRIP